MYLNNKVYDTLKWIAQYFLPALAALYYALSDIWGLPYPGEIVGSLVALDAFLGTILGISTLNFRKEQALEGYMPVTSMDQAQVGGMSSTTYDVLKWTLMIFMPASGTLYLALSMQWGWPYGDQVVGTIAALTTFGGLLLGVSTARYKRNR